MITTESASGLALRSDTGPGTVKKEIKLDMYIRIQFNKPSSSVVIVIVAVLSPVPASLTPATWNV